MPSEIFPGQDRTIPTRQLVERVRLYLEERYIPLDEIPECADRVAYSLSLSEEEPIPPTCHPASQPEMRSCGLSFSAPPKPYRKETNAEASVCRESMPRKESAETRLRRLLEKRSEETFSQMTLRVMRERDWSNPEVYNRVHMDRKTFNKIINHPEYQPGKRTALQMAVALRLNPDETRDLLRKAGYALTDTSRFDIVISYFIENALYDIYEIDSVAFELTGMTLSSG